MLRMYAVGCPAFAAVEMQKARASAGLRTKVVSLKNSERAGPSRISTISCCSDHPFRLTTAAGQVRAARRQFFTPSYGLSWYVMTLASTQRGRGATRRGLWQAILGALRWRDFFVLSHRQLRGEWVAPHPAALRKGMGTRNLPAVGAVENEKAPAEGLSRIRGVCSFSSKMSHSERLTSPRWPCSTSN